MPASATGNAQAHARPTGGSPEPPPEEVRNSIAEPNNVSTADERLQNRKRGGSAKARSAERAPERLPRRGDGHPPYSARMGIRGACPPAVYPGEGTGTPLIQPAWGFGLVITAPHDDGVCRCRTVEEEERRRHGGVCRDDTRTQRGCLTSRHQATSRHRGSARGRDTKPQ